MFSYINNRPQSSQIRVQSPWSQVKWIAGCPMDVKGIFGKKAVFGCKIFEREEGVRFTDVNGGRSHTQRISRKHFEICKCEFNPHYIQEFPAYIKVHSANGVELNGIHIKGGESRILCDGDTISVGNQPYFDFRYVDPLLNSTYYPRELTSQYLIGNFINKGGQGSVREVFALKIVNNVHKETKFAMKVVQRQRDNFENSQDYAKRLEHLRYEVHNMRDLVHVNIIKFMDYIQSPYESYIIMEFCNTDLLKYLKHFQLKKIPESTAILIFYQICRGLRVIHSKGIAHRDIKLENIFMSVLDTERHGRIPIPKIGDFGFSKPVADHLQTQLGTPCYSPPECLINCNEYDLSVDIWSLGCVFFSMLSGTYAFHQSYKQPLHEQILAGNIHWGDENNWLYVSQKTRNVIRMCIQVDPNARPKIHEIMELNLFCENVEIWSKIQTIYQCFPRSV